MAERGSYDVIPLEEVADSSMFRAQSMASLHDIPLEDATRQKLDGSTELYVLVIGRYKMGKSTLINCLFFEKGKRYEKLAIEGSMDPTTKEVTPYVLKWKDISYNIYDTPGLQDGQEDDIVYL